MNALIIANGDLPHPRIMHRLARAADIIVCADGGANGARKLRLTPDIILGDLDSLKPVVRARLNNTPVFHIPDQESTDLEKALIFSIRSGYSSADVVGATGDRIDHTTGSLGCFRKFGTRIAIRMFDTVGILTHIRGEIRFTAKPGETLSLIPLNRCTGITTKNLRYALRDGCLELGVREGISNEVIDKDVRIRVKRGTLLLFRRLETLDSRRGNSSRKDSR